VYENGKSRNNEQKENYDEQFLVFFLHSFSYHFQCEWRKQEQAIICKWTPDVFPPQCSGFLQ